MNTRFEQLVDACKMGDLESANLLMSRSTNIHAKNDKLIKTICDERQFHMLRWLLEQGELHDNPFNLDVLFNDVVQTMDETSIKEVLECITQFNARNEIHVEEHIIQNDITEKNNLIQQKVEVSMETNNKILDQVLLELEEITKNNATRLALNEKSEESFNSDETSDETSDDDKPYPPSHNGIDWSKVIIGIDTNNIWSKQQSVDWDEKLIPIEQKIAGTIELNLPENKNKNNNFCEDDCSHSSMPELEFSESDMSKSENENSNISEPENKNADIFSAFVNLTDDDINYVTGKINEIMGVNNDPNMTQFVKNITDYVIDGIKNKNVFVQQLLLLTPPTAFNELFANESNEQQSEDISLLERIPNEQNEQQSEDISSLEHVPKEMISLEKEPFEYGDYNVPEANSLRKSVIKLMIEDLGSFIELKKMHGQCEWKLLAGQCKYFEEIKEILTNYGYTVSLTNNSLYSQLLIEW